MKPTGPVIRSVSFAPIASWPLVLALAALVVGLTIWAYRQRLHGTAGRWRFVALGLRMAAVLLCLLAALRPSVIMLEKVKQAATLIFMVDSSTSMTINDEVQGQKRWDVAIKGLEAGRERAKTLGPGLDAKFYSFDTTLRERKPDDKAEPNGQQTALGDALMECLKRQSGGRVAGIILFSDGAQNSGLAALTAAQHLQSQQVPVIPIGLGSESVAAASRDIAVRNLVVPPTVFVKNKIQVRGTLNVRGYPRQPIEVELLVEDRQGHDEPVGKVTVRAGEGAEEVAIHGLEYTPQIPGETRLKLRVKPKEGELVRSNNELASYVKVLKGGLSVLYVHGRNFSWEYRYLSRTVDASRDIQLDLAIIRKQGELRDEDLQPGKYDVYILGDLPADFLTPTQQGLLVASVERGAGMLMLGGRDSFGMGGWANSVIASILPVEIHAGDGEIDKPVKVRPVTRALDEYILRLGPNAAESKRIWDMLPEIPGANRLGPLKRSAILFAQMDGPAQEPIMVGQEVGKGRVLAFGGETWVWYRASDEAQLAHRKFWRQAIFWLSHKENQGESLVKLTLDRRRISLGEKVELSVTARDAKNEPIRDAKYETKVVRISADAKPEPVELYPQGDVAHGTYFASAAPGEYKVTVSGSRDGKDLGQDSARFLVYQDDRELENPAADHALLRQIAEVTGGKFLTPEQLGKHLRSLNSKDFLDTTSQTERKVWDNWYFFLAFVVILTAEWWLRKKNGWV